MRMQFHVTRGPWGDVEIRLGSKEPDGSFSIATAQISIARVPEGQCIPTEPLLTIGHMDAPEALQSLMDGLWAVGVRPADIGTPGHLKATEKHLEDMRAITFSRLGVEKP